MFLLDELESELVQIYTTTNAARLVVDQAGIPAATIEFDGTIAQVWHRIVEQADRRDKLPDLLRVVLRDYPNRVKLHQMLGTYVYPRDQDEGYRELPMSVRGDDGYQPRLGERVARLEEKTETGFRLLNERLDDITAALAARPVASAAEKRVESIVVWIGVGFAILIVALLLLWVRLGMPS